MSRDISDDEGLPAEGAKDDPVRSLRSVKRRSYTHEALPNKRPYTTASTLQTALATEAISSTTTTPSDADKVASTTASTLQTALATEVISSKTPEAPTLQLAHESEGSAVETIPAMKTVPEIEFVSAIPKYMHSFPDRLLWTKPRDPECALTELVAVPDDEIVKLKVGDTLKFKGHLDPDTWFPTIMDFRRNTIVYGYREREVLTMTALEEATCLAYQKVGKENSAFQVIAHPKHLMVKRNPRLTAQYMETAARRDEQSVAKEWNERTPLYRELMMTNYPMCKNWDIEHQVQIPDHETSTLPASLRPEAGEDKSYRFLVELPSSKYDMETKHFSNSSHQYQVVQDKHPCPLCLTEKILPCAFGSILADTKLTRSDIKRIKRHCMDEKHSLLWFTLGNSTLHGNTKLTIKCYIQRLLEESITTLKVTFHEQKEPELLFGIGSILGHAQATHDTGSRLKQYGASTAIRGAFKTEAGDVFRKIYLRLREFDHFGWTQGAPNQGVPAMSKDEICQCLNLFFRRGLYWQPPYPALSDVLFPETTIDKSAKTLEREKSASEMEKKKRAQEGRTKKKKPRKEKAIENNPPKKNDEETATGENHAETETAFYPKNSISI
jgi:hypothetical protein